LSWNILANRAGAVIDARPKRKTRGCRRMLYRLKSHLAKTRFQRLTAGIMDTPPMPVVDAPWNIVSLFHKCDAYAIQMYLLAIKSFYARIGRGKITLIVERDLSPAVRELLQHHLPGVGFAVFEDIDVGACQHGGTWERLLFLLDSSRDEYSIQLDADTLTFGPDIDEVVRCAENNIAFALGNGARPIETMASVAASARAIDSNYIGIVAERLFDRYPDAEHVKYVRASSAFCGFSRGGFSRAQIEEFHREGEKLLGVRWTEWGTEQCGSNFAIANSPGAVVLPYPKYGNNWPGLKREGNAFLHFFGTHRYDGDHFARLAKGVIAELNGRK
jgi:hypothetical protein